MPSLPFSVLASWCQNPGLRQQVCRVDDRIDGAFDERMTIEALLEDYHIWLICLLMVTLW
jgi:hypothetical protein